MAALQGPDAAGLVQRVALDAVLVLAASGRAVVVGRDMGLVGSEAAGRAVSALAAAQASWRGLVAVVGSSPVGWGAAAAASRRLRRGLASVWCPGDVWLATEALTPTGDLRGLLTAQSVGLAAVVRVAVAVFSAIDRESRRAGTPPGRRVAARRIVGTSAAAWGAVRDASALAMPGRCPAGGVVAGVAGGARVGGAQRGVG